MRPRKNPTRKLLTKIGYHDFSGLKVQFTVEFGLKPGADLADLLSVKLCLFVALTTLAYAQTHRTNVQRAQNLAVQKFKPASTAVLPHPPEAYGLPYHYINQPLTPLVRCVIVDKEGYPVAVTPPPGTPAFVYALNKGIPGFNSEVSGDNILEYGNSQCVGGNQPYHLFYRPKLGKKDEEDDQPSVAPNLPMGALGGLGNGMNRGPTYNPEYGGYSNSGGGGGNSDFSSQSAGHGAAGSGNSGPDSLCSDPKSKQAQVIPPYTESYCKTIQNTILDGTRGPFCKESNAELADKIGNSNIEDMTDFCPGWDTIKTDRDKRAIFLMNFVAAMVTPESNWDPGATGDKERGPEHSSKGLLQLTKASDQAYGCDCKSMNDEYNPIQNLKCGTHMFLYHIARDGTVGKGGKDGTPARGLARSWGPFQREGERRAIMNRTAEWCRKSLNFSPARAEPPQKQSAPTLPLPKIDDPRLPKGAR